MRFSSIEIINYRQYRDVTLTFKKGSTDLQVIVGDNGTGKTNLLNAFTWCLYGKEPHLGSDAREKGEPKLNKDVALELSEEGPRTVSVSVRVEIEADDETIRVHRSVPFLVKSATNVIEKKAEESYSVIVVKADGSSKVVGDDVADSYVDKLLPEAIREYFFFDGEQLNNYFNETRSGVIRSAVHSIAQIDSLTRMKDRTNRVASELMRKGRSTSPDLKRFTDAIRKNEDQADRFSSLAAEDEAQADQIKEKLTELEDNLRGLPKVDVLEEKRRYLKEQKAKKESVLRDAMESYCVFARSMYVDFSFYEAAKAAIDAISKMERDNQLPPAIDSSLLKSMLSSHICEVCRRPLSEDEEAHIRELLDLYQVGTETSGILTSLRQELRELIRRVERYPKDRDQEIKRLAAAQEDLEAVEREIEENEDQYRKCPNPDQVKNWIAERNRFEQELSKKTESAIKRRTYENMYRNKASKERDKYDNAIRQKGLGDEFQKAGDFGLRAGKIIEQVEKKVIAETRESIERQTEELFKGLVWKDSKCERIALDDNYQLSLFDKYGFSCAATCSAAERALLALSFTLAMHSVSGFESPLFIDTPIARASGDNRANFAKTLAEVSKAKQLILTFTPDEYSEAIANVFDPICASHLRLVLDEGEKVVSVKGGE